KSVPLCLAAIITTSAAHGNIPPGASWREKHVESRIMSALSTLRRCQGCGARLSEGQTDACPSCHRALAEVGVSSELSEWGDTRKIGRQQYVWKYGALRWGLIGTFVFACSSGFFWRNPGAWMILGFGAAAITALGYFLGAWHWSAAEREYR